jgi:hypothetical protein
VQLSGLALSLARFTLVSDVECSSATSPAETYEAEGQRLTGVADALSDDGHKYTTSMWRRVHAYTLRLRRWLACVRAIRLRDTRVRVSLPGTDGSYLALSRV